MADSASTHWVYMLQRLVALQDSFFDLLSMATAHEIAKELHEKAGCIFSIFQVYFTSFAADMTTLIFNRKKCIRVYTRALCYMYIQDLIVKSSEISRLGLCAAVYLGEFRISHAV